MGVTGAAPSRSPFLPSRKLSKKKDNILESILFDSIHFLYYTFIIIYLTKEKDMKKRVFTQKLTLSKETVSHLNPEDMRKSLGGGTYTCPGLNCPSLLVDCG